MKTICNATSGRAVYHPDYKALVGTFNRRAFSEGNIPEVIAIDGWENSKREQCILKELLYEDKLLIEAQGKAAEIWDNTIELIVVASLEPPKDVPFHGRRIQFIYTKR
jgi:hypothetical protein